MFNLKLIIFNIVWGYCASAVGHQRAVEIFWYHVVPLDHLTLEVMFQAALRPLLATHRNFPLKFDF